MNLANKRLLILTGCNGDKDIISYAKRAGIYTFATDYYTSSLVKSEADHQFDVSTVDVDGVAKLAKRLNVDGIVTGASEASNYTILEVTKRLGLPYFADMDQLESVNNKSKFKKILMANNVPVPEEIVNYCGTEYPVIVKPVDASSHKGISVCQDFSQLSKALSIAKGFSRSGHVIVEKFISGICEVFANYTIIDGYASLSCLFDNYKITYGDGLADVNMFNLYPSKHVDLFYEKIHPHLVSAFNSINLRNGIISVQMMFDGSEFYVYEGGYRVGGTQSYIFCDFANGVNPLEMMVNHALTGVMSSDQTTIERDTPKFTRPCCQLNFPLLHGTIARIDGLDTIEDNAGVLNVTRIKGIGSKIIGRGTANEFLARIHIGANNKAQLLSCVEDILDNVRVMDTNGHDMLLPDFRNICGQQIKHKLGIST